MKLNWPYTINTGTSQSRALQAWYPGGPSGSITLHDRSKLGIKPGTLVGSPTWVYGFNGGNGALNFDGTNYVNIPVSGNGLDNTLNYTLSAWIKPTNLPVAGTFRGILAKEGGSADAFGYYLGHNGSSAWFGHNRGANEVTGGTLVAGQWTLITGVFLSTTGLSLYLNGILVASNSVTTVATATAGSLKIGKTIDAADVDLFFQGTIEDCRIYNKFFTATEVYELYRQESRWALRYRPKLRLFSTGHFLEQEGFRFRKDDTDETWIIDQDINVTQPTLENKRLRIVTNITNDPPSQAFKLQWRKVGTNTWQDVT